MSSIHTVVQNSLSDELERDCRLHLHIRLAFPNCCRLAEEARNSLKYINAACRELSTLGLIKENGEESVLQRETVDKNQLQE